MFECPMCNLKRHVDIRCGADTFERINQYWFKHWAALGADIASKRGGPLKRTKTPKPRWNFNMRKAARIAREHCRRSAWRVL